MVKANHDEVSSNLSIVATAGQHTLKLTTTALEEDVPNVMNNLIAVVNRYGEAICDISNKRDPNPECDERKRIAHKHDDTISASLLPFTASSEQSDEESPLNDSDITKRYTREERAHYNCLTHSQRQSIITSTRQILQSDAADSIPLRFRLLSSHLPIEVKKRILQKLDRQAEALSSHDSVKLHTWIEILVSLPLNLYVLPAPDMNTGKVLFDAKAYLDCVVYGHRNAKHAILERLYAWLKNPLTPQRPLALIGAPGNGKTSLIKHGLARIMMRFFYFISLGGAIDSSILLGHNYTYEGSQPGKIVECLVQAKSMNPILMFDELDKISETPKGDEILNTLIHITDATQADCFHDRYLQNINIDLSKTLCVFTLNRLDRVSPVLLDRLQLVHTDVFTKQDQERIVKEYLIPATLREVNVSVDQIVFSDEAVKALLCLVDVTSGVRQLRALLERVISKVMIYSETKCDMLLYPINVHNLVCVALQEKDEQSHQPVSCSSNTRSYSPLFSQVTVTGAAVNDMLSGIANDESWKNMYI